jgi:2-hydroxychromene-2-carboxylate isomerase
MMSGRNGADGIDFWYSMGSSYSYLTIARLDDVASRERISFRWRPFNVRVIMMEQQNIPFANKPVKAKYMWRDLERRAQKYGIPMSLPIPFPAPDMELANRVAVLGEREGWGSAYTKAAYHRWFVHREIVGGEPNLANSLKAIGKEPSQILATARSDDIGVALQSANDEARRLNVFGVPSFVTRGEVFWGDDRLDDAIQWYRTGSLASKVALRAERGSSRLLARLFSRSS